MNAAFPEVETDEQDEKREEEGKENGDDADEDRSIDSDGDDDKHTVKNNSDSTALGKSASRSERCSKSQLCQTSGTFSGQAKAKALNVLLPAHRWKLRRLYLHYFKCFRGLRREKQAL